MRRFGSALRVELALQRRHGLWAVALFVIAGWGALLGAVPAVARADAAALGPPLVTFNLVATAFYFAGGLVLFDAEQGTRLALAVTPLRVAEHLAARALALAALGLVESGLVALLLFATRPAPLAWLAGAGLLAIVYALVGAGAACRYPSVTAFLMPSAALVTVLVLPLAALGRPRLAPLVWLHPAGPATLLLGAAYRPLPALEAAAAGAGAALWAALALLWARGRFARTSARP